MIFSTLLSRGQCLLLSVVDVSTAVVGTDVLSLFRVATTTVVVMALTATVVVVAIMAVMSPFRRQ